MNNNRSQQLLIIFIISIAISIFDEKTNPLKCLCCKCPCKLSRMPVMNASVTSWALRLARQTFATQTSCNAGMTLATQSITRLVRFACHASSHVCFLPFKGSRHTNAGTHDCRSPFQAQTHALVYIKNKKKRGGAWFFLNTATKN